MVKKNIDRIHPVRSLNLDKKSSFSFDNRGAYDRGTSNGVHQKFMKNALKLAKRGRGLVSPNPLVGCVIVSNNRIAGKGYYQYFGGPHAEINALRDAGEKAVNSTMYVTLEPCCFYGKTPPCTEAIIRSGVKEVVIGMEDPNPKVNGRGIQKLKAKRIKVTTDILKKQATKLNEAYIKYVTKKVPFVILKTAMSLDGKIASVTGDSKWISSEKSRQWVHRLRSQVDGVLVGINTVLKDNPGLTAHGLGKNPLRIVLDGEARIPLKSQLLNNQAPTLVVTAHSPGKLSVLKRRGIRVLRINAKNGKINLKVLLRRLAKMGITSLLVEGGGETNASFLKEKLVDKVLVFIGPKIVGGRNAITPVAGNGIDKISQAIKLDKMSIKKIDEDILIEGYLNYNP